MTLLLSLFMAFTLIPASALAWNPFKQKTFEDCVLEKINDVKGEDAVRALQAACAEKYPFTNTTKPDEKSTYTVCKGKKWSNSETIRVNMPTQSDIGSVKVISSKWVARGDLELAVQNYYKASFESAKIEVFFSNKDEADAVYQCTGYIQEGVVGKLYCRGIDERMKKFRIESLTTNEVNAVEFLKRMKKCD